ncbi:hypothetical protein [Gimesia fumaroli]|jgi:hypothetical protein|uniref:Uncharacterized protein n=1 Tax=Gimesia fumaroli TaxID=2527976 RepID=A0A518IEK0_9PLAN|nr:hypothetical protein [Gimesia fumaroli]QDV51505.1 hypothetical protein Enr17x_35610 [Gimesia fumaroli]
MKSRKLSSKTLIAVQVLVVVAFCGAYTMGSRDSRQVFNSVFLNQATYPEVKIDRKVPLQVEPLYDDPSVVTDEELAAVLKQVRPKFPRKHMKPNHVEHALRTWSIRSTFQDPSIVSGIEMRDFLIDHARFLASWGDDASPLLVDEPKGISIRWGSQVGGSVHHDHWLASLTEAGIHLDEPVFAPARRDMDINDVIQQSLRDFRLDEREVEWSAMAFGLWIPPVKQWKTTDGRSVSFDQIVQRLIRGHKKFGVCVGTHRVYSLMLLIRLDDEYDILSDRARANAYGYLERVRDLISVCQFEDGHWPANWMDGKTALTNPEEIPEYKNVIATGHHLEWLAIAPKELHPPHEQIVKAAKWIINNTTSHTEDEILQKYTFYSHVGNALALWRHTHAAKFWDEWQETHPYVPEAKADNDAIEAPKPTL